ncbi:hypothetical protein [Clostridium botulinum]|uniref:Conserved domain protein n=1 Tax=Clostridium botulinum (strain Langeland / NCTC 10281 / Type F) TaxID=441772 RepID=A7GD11_CLOBL|nr:hypothetical protein [Clostridium botulinum]ABS42160.1 conserved domain protein [Clostridium botulinum F str. Langeland]ADF99124.1 conserved domain protein [Clostridium botulinum F str. 230613]KEI75479.1 membrane protein [Clostridium botulinum B2 128]KEI89199.1 membrane protein [Clostridium botulinum B2 433]KEI91637.1 membrane protein [Clostridium botulinum B2 275]
MNISKSGLTFLQFALSFIIYKLLMNSFSFNYNLFSDKFNILKFFMDFGCWVIVYLIVCFIFSKLVTIKKGK